MDKTKNKIAFVLVLAFTFILATGFASACHCGDGSVNVAGEECDDGNLINGDGCSSTCQTEEGCNLQLTKLKDKTNVQPGDIVTFTLKYKNIGDSICTGGGVKIQDILDENLDYMGSFTKNILNDIDGQGLDPAWYEIPGYDALTNTLTWNAHVVSPNEEGIITFEVEVLTPTQCGDFQIPNYFKAWSNQEDWKNSNTVTLFVDNDCPPQPFCGDGIINQVSETCDDGNTANNDGCSSTCKLEVCGDQICNGDETCSTCSQDCGVCPPPTCPTCGNGIKETGEQCDDGNLVNGDGCSRVCYLEEDADYEPIKINHFVQFCDVNWMCSGWSECIDGMMTRDCIDKNNCDIEYNKPYETSGCNGNVLSKVYIEAENLNSLWIIIGIILFVVLLVILVNLFR